MTTTDRRTRLGMLTPSSNTVLEPVTARLLADLPDVTAHFARFRVTEISLSEAALGQFDADPMLAAADLLADARVDAICWNGTSSGWLGFDRDEALCAAIRARTGVPAASAVLGFNALFHAAGVRRFGLVTPYVAEVQERILANYAAAGIDCVAERHLGLSENFAFGCVPAAEVGRLCREVAAERPDAIAVLCTNLEGVDVATAVEAETGVPVFDSVAVALWAALCAAGHDPRRLSGVGGPFVHGAPADAPSAPLRAQSGADVRPPPGAQP